MMAPLRLALLAFLSLVSSAALAGNLIVNLAPSQAVTAGAQWRVDGGAWKSSGVTVKNLTNAAHTVDYKAVAGWIAPAATSITLTNNVTTTLTGTYVVLPSLKVTLTPTSGQWRVDGGVWRASGATVTGLSVGSHTISYNAVATYVAPPTESVTLGAEQNLILTRAYTPPGQLFVTLTPASGQWRVDGGVWRASQTSSGLITAGAHTIEFAPVASYVAPATQSVTVTASQTTNLSFSYAVARPASLTVNVVPSTGQWRLLNGAWQPSGATLSGLLAGDYTIELASVPGWFDAPNYAVTLAELENKTVTFSHLQQASITVTLAPGSAQWRATGGLLPSPGAWQSSGATIGALYPGNYTLEYAPVAGLGTPAGETFYLAAGEQKVVLRNYSGPPSLTLNLTPAAGQWRLDGGAWRASGGVAFNVALGAHTIDYAPLGGYLAPPSETLWFRQDQPLNLSRTYVSAAGSYLRVKTVPAYLMESGDAKWRVDGGSWNAAGAPVAVSSGAHTLEFQPTAGLDVPPASTVTTSTGAVQTVEATFYLKHRLRFFFHPVLVGNLTTPELQGRVAQYAAQVQEIFTRETLRRLSFDPATDIAVVSASPFSQNLPIPAPEYGFELWAYADSGNGSTSGGSMLGDISGAAGAGGMHWSQIYDPSALAPGSPELQQYWKQIRTLVHEFQHTFGAGYGEYYSMFYFTDSTGVAPVYSVNYNDLADPFMNAHPDFTTDPLLTSAWGNPWVGAPTALPALAAATHFSATSRGIIDGCWRNADSPFTTRTTLPDLTRVRISVVDAGTGQPIPGATLRIWNQPNPGPMSGQERTVTATATPGVFEFNWTSDSTYTPLNSWDNGKLLKAFATGYQAKAEWEWIYDAQRVRTVDQADVWNITVALTPAP